MTNQPQRRIGKNRYPQLLAMIEAGQTMPEIAAALDVSQESVRRFAKRRGLTIRPAEQAGENHPSWKGGTTLDRSGYILRRVEQDGPHGYLIRAIRKGDPRGYAPEHRIVMHEKLGRPLRPGEVVDHIDGDRTNNAPENLRVFASNADHLRETLKGRRPNWTDAGYRQMCAKMEQLPDGSRRRIRPPEST